MMDAPVSMLVDPWPMSDERRTAKGKLKGRGHVLAAVREKRTKRELDRQIRTGAPCAETRAE